MISLLCFPRRWRAGLLGFAVALALSPGAARAQTQTQPTAQVVGTPTFSIDEFSAVGGVSDLEQRLYQTQLYGAFSVRFSGLKPGIYKVVVGNAELAFSQDGQRIFTLAANGTPAVSHLDLHAQFGMAKKADVSFPATADQGTLEIGFIPEEKHDNPRMSFVRVYDADGALAAELTALSQKPKDWAVHRAPLGYLPDVIRTFPKSDPAGAFPDLKVYDAAGRPWRAAAEDWDGARRRVQADPEWAAWLAKQRADADAWMARHPQDRVEWACGWYHDFVSPKDGSFLDWTDQIPGEEAPYLHSPSDPRVEVTPKLLAGWVYHFRGKHASTIQQAARLYRLTGEEAYAAWAARQLDYYADHLAEWPPGSRSDGSRIYWQTLDEAVNLSLYSDAARLLGDYVKPERLQAWKTKFFYPEAEMLDHTMLRIHNIATWHRCAEADVALLFHDDALLKRALDGEFGLRRQLASGVTSDYVWWEQSFHYNYYLFQAMLGFFERAGIAGRADLVANEMAIAEDVPLSLVYLRFPDKRLPMPADSTGGEVAPDLSLMASAYRVFPTTIGLDAAATKRNWDTLLDPPPPSPRAPVLPEVTGRHLESARMALLKSGPWQVYFHYGQLTNSHAQAEALNFEASYRDVDVTHDPGTVGYGSPMHAGYYTRGLNHNVPLADGEGEYVVPQAGEVSDYGDSPARITAALPGYRPGVSASRTLRIDGDKLIDTATIKAADGAPRKLGLSLHLQGAVRLPEAFRPDPRFAAGRPDPFSYWTGVTKAEFRDKAEFDVAFGSTTLHVSLSVPGAFTVWHGSTPDIPPKRREGFYVETTAAGATFVTVLSPAP